MDDFPRETVTGTTAGAPMPYASDRVPADACRPSLGYLFLKRLADILLAGLALVVLSPVFLLVAVLVKLEDGGQVIHRRTMCCIGSGKRYIMYKFRSMVPDADCLSKYFSPEQMKQYQREVKVDGDPRITRIGKWIRKTSLDELPQLLNILKGDMSIVGPRPVVAEELAYYQEQGQLFASVKPGLTGYWQVNGRSDSTYASGRRQKLEIYYAMHRCLRLDLQILFKTFLVVLHKTGAK